MNKYYGSLTFTFVTGLLFICSVAIAIDPNAAAQTHDRPKPADRALDHETTSVPDHPASGLRHDPAGEPLTGDDLRVATTSHDKPAVLVGKLLSPEDRAIPHTPITLTEANGTELTTATDSFGNFRFNEVYGGQQIQLSAEGGRYSFTDLAIEVSGETTVSWRATSK
jgi:hypothetical protein